MAAMAADPLAAEVVGALEREDEEDCAQQWYFAREELERRSPSRADGMDAKRETYLRRSYCTFLQDLGMRLKVPQITIATAIVFCHRFFLRQSHLRNDRFTIATVCMFLAGKVEETPRPLKDVITTAHEVQTKKDPEALARIRQKEHYEEQRELVLVGERLLLTTLGFDLNVLHPYRPLVAAVRRIGAAQQALAQVAWNFVNDGLRTSLCLQFRPHQIAAGAIFLAAKFLRIKLPPSTDQKGFHGFDVTESQLKEVSSQMLELYEQSKGASRGSIPSSNAAAPPSKGPPRASSAPLLQQSNGHTAHSSRPKPDSVSVNGPLATPRAFGRPTPSTGEQGYGPSLSESSSWQRSDAQPIKENRTTDEANGVSLDEDDAMSLDSEGGGVERAPQALQSVSPPESGGRNGEADQSGGGLHSVSPSKTGEGGKRKREESTLEDERGWRKEFERRKVVGTRVIETGPSEQRSELVKGESEQDEDEADEEQQRAWELLDEVELGGPVKERGTKSKVRKGVQGLLPMPLGEPSALTTLPECETGSVDENINGVGRRTASSRPRSGEETEGIKVDDFQAARGGIQGEADSQEGRDMRWRDEGNRSDTEGNPPHVLPKQRSPEVSRRGGDEAVEEGELPEGEGPSSPPVRGEVGLRKAGKEPLDSWRQSSRGQGAPMRAYSHGRDRHRERELDKDRHRQRDEGSPPKEQSIRRSKFS